MQEQQERINKIDRYVDDLAFQMKDWIDNDLPSRPKSSNRINDKRIGGGGRIGTGTAGDKSQSPVSQMRKRGEEFLRKIETLKETLHP